LRIYYNSETKHFLLNDAVARLAKAFVGDDSPRYFSTPSPQERYPYLQRLQQILCNDIDDACSNRKIHIGKENTVTWIFWAVLSAIFAAGTALLAKIGVEGIDSNLAAAIRTTVVLIFTWTLALSLNAHHGLGQITRRGWIFLVLSGMCTGLSWLCYFRALQMGPVSGVAPIDKLSVAIVIIAGWVFFGESMSPAKIAGAALVTVGALVMAFA
jgi:transporter family protein